MKNINYWLTINCMLLFGLLFNSITASSQTLERSILATAGENFSNEKYSMHFTFGESITETFANGNQLSQGFQQVFVITTAVIDNASEEWNVNIFPNPTVGTLHVQTIEPLKIMIYDINGYLILEKKDVQEQTEISLEQLPAGIYNLMLQPEQGKDVKSFRVVKVQ